MNDAFVLKGRLELDTTGFDDGLDGATEKAKKFGQEGEKASKTWEDAFSFSAGQLMADALKKSWELMKKTTKEAISLSSSLNEVQNVVDVTFGDGAEQINTWAKSALSAFGMSELSAKKYVSTMGAMLKSMGLTNDAAQDMSMSVVSLAADMASFYNMNHEEIMTKIRSGFAGEIEPLRQLGINMSVANLEAYALAQGIDKTWSSMTQAEQVMLRYNYLLDATADAAGDFSRTSGEYANQVTQLTENLKTVKTEYGNVLVDILTPQLQEVNKLLTEWLAGNQLKDLEESLITKEKDEIDEANREHSEAYYLIGELEAMRDAKGEAAENTEEWVAACKALALVMPELGQYIDTNTGKLKASTDELRKNADAIHALAVYEAKERAVNSYSQAVTDAENARADQLIKIWEKQAEIKGYQNASLAARNRIVEATGFTINQVANALLADVQVGTNAGRNALRKAGASKEDVEAGFAAISSYTQARNELKALNSEYAELEESVTAAREALEEKQIALEMAAAGLDADALASRDFYEALQSQTTALDNVNEALVKTLGYYDKLKDSARESIASVAKSLSEQIDIKPVKLSSVTSAMKTDTAWMSKYAENIEAAKKAGMDADMLAFLANGDEENIAILDAWVSQKGSRETFNAQYKSYVAAQEAAATAMADAQAEVDKEYQALEDELEAMVEAFNNSDELTASLLASNTAIAEGFNTIVDSVATGVQGVNNILAGLPGSFSLNFSAGGNSGDNATPNAKGLGYVPYDNYLTRLHKGESVLSRVEAENWRKGANNASAGIDYDRLAAVLASNMAGMSMQMDGKMIGALIAPVVSRNIEKEAWRGRY